MKGNYQLSISSQACTQASLKRLPAALESYKPNQPTNTKQKPQDSTHKNKLINIQIKAHKVGCT